MANATVLKLKKDEREKRKEIILLAAQKLFSKQGLSGVNMRDIASQAGVSVGFIYRYFPGRTDIFVELFEAGASEIMERFTNEIEAGGPTPIHRLARAYVNYLHENDMFYQMMIHFMLEGKLSKKALNRVNKALRRIVDIVEVVFRDDGENRNARILAHSFFAALHGVMISFVNYPGRTPQEIRNRTFLLAETIADQFQHKSHQK